MHEQYFKIVIDPNEDDTVNFRQIMQKLGPEVAQEMEGKIISYFHRSYNAFVYLGCIAESEPRMAKLGKKAFNPDEIEGCQNGLSEDIKIENLLQRTGAYDHIKSGDYD